MGDPQYYWDPERGGPAKLGRSTVDAPRAGRGGALVGREGGAALHVQTGEEPVPRRLLQSPLGCALWLRCRYVPSRALITLVWIMYNKIITFKGNLWIFLVWNSCFLCAQFISNLPTLFLFKRISILQTNWMVKFPLSRSQVHVADNRWIFKRVDRSISLAYFVQTFVYSCSENLIGLELQTINVLRML